MKSSFKKVQRGTCSQKGYFGHPDLDAIFYNSLLKGHLMVLQEDHPTTNYLSLLRYFVSSSYHNQLPILIYDSTPQKWKHLICDKKKNKNQQIQQQQKKSQIAWRYDKMNINLNQLIISDEIYSLDLTKQIQKINNSFLYVYGYQNCSIQKFYKNIYQNFLNCHKDQKDIELKKILLSSIPSYFYNDIKFSQFLHALRCLTRTSHVLTLITIPPIINQQIRKKLLIFCDYYLQIGKIGQGYDDFTSTLTILKQVQTCQIRTKYRGVSIWGIKNKKKQLKIQTLYQMAIKQQKTQKQQQKKIDF